jgi:hypothetical protein
VIAFLALFRDAWRRARDRKTVTILVVLGLMIALLCASFRFGRAVPAESLRRQLSECSIQTRGPVRRGTGGLAFLFGSPLKRAPTVHVREPTVEDDLPLGLANVTVAELQLPDLEEFDRIVMRWREVGGATPVARGSGDARLSARDRADYLESMLRGHGWETVLAKPQGDEANRFLVAAATDHLSDLEGRWQFDVMFGAVSIPLSDVSPAQVVVVAENSIFRLFSGLIGMLVLLSAFSGAMPDLLQKGQLDLVLARPIGRTRLLLHTYVGAVVTVLLLTATVFLACALTLGFRSGHFSVAFVGCAVTTTAIFAALHPVAMLCGYLTGNANIATLAAMACWGTAEGLVGWRVYVADEASNWTRAVDWAIRLMPKTSDLSNLGGRWLAKTEFSPQAFERFKEQFPVVTDPGWAMGSTAIWAAFFLLVTALLFRRRDC